MAKVRIIAIQIDQKPPETDSLELAVALMKTMTKARITLRVRYINGWTRATFLGWLSLSSKKSVLLRFASYTVLSISIAMIDF